MRFGDFDFKSRRILFCPNRNFKSNSKNTELNQHDIIHQSYNCGIKYLHEHWCH